MAILQHNKKHKRKKAFSILEMMISLVVISFILLIFFNTIITSLKLSYQNLGRSLVREEATAFTLIIADDIGNADLISTCEKTSCHMLVEGEDIAWGVCDETGALIERDELQPTDFICKIDESDGSIIYTSDSKILLRSLEFEVSTPAADGIAQNVLVTVVATHQTENLNIGDIVRQVSVSTKNYEI